MKSSSSVGGQVGKFTFCPERSREWSPWRRVPLGRPSELHPSVSFPSSRALAFSIGRTPLISQPRFGDQGRGLIHCHALKPQHFRGFSFICIIRKIARMSSSMGPLSLILSVCRELLNSRQTSLGHQCSDTASSWHTSVTSPELLGGGQKTHTFYP